MKELLRRFGYLFRRSRFHAELDDEIEFHIETRADEIEREGVPRVNALAQARREFGHATRAREETRSAWQIRWIVDAVFDLRYAARAMRRSPGFAAVAVTSLALGIGAATAVFSVVNAVVLRPLPFPDPDRLMAIQTTDLKGTEPWGTAAGVYADWRDRATSFESVAGARNTSAIMSGTGQPRKVNVGAVSFDFFRVLGKQPLRGRMFTSDEDRTNAERVALLDADLWRREFGGRDDVFGRTLILNDRPHTIVGVMPPDIRLGQLGEIEVWIPMSPNREHRSGGDVVALGRLRNGVTLGAARAEMESIMSGIRRERQQDSKTGVRVIPLRDSVVGDVRPVFLTLLGAVLFVLLICCANIANLLMARATARQKEMAVRSTLGAGRFRLVRQTLAESTLLAAIGGAAGLGLALAMIRAVPAIRAFYIPRADEIAIDGSILSIAGIVSLASAVLFGSAPAFQIGRGDLSAALHGGVSALRRGGGHRLRNSLVVAQLALALVLLAGAGLMTNSLVRLLNIELGFERPHVLTISTRLPFKYDLNRELDFHYRLMEQVKSMPGVEEVSGSDYMPLMAVRFPYQIGAPGVSGKMEAMARHIAPNYLRVLSIPLLAGRDLEPADDGRFPVPALISQSMARSLFGSANPLGRQLTTPYRGRKTIEVVGVVGDVRQLDLRSEPGAQLYLPQKYGSAHFVIARTAANAGNLHKAIRQAVLALDPEVPAPQISSMDELYSREMAKPRFYLGLLAAFAGCGVMLAAIGIYGVMAYTLARRTREFGIRMALGATRQNILSLSLGLGVRLTCTGVVLGVVGAVAATRLLSTLLYGVRPGDPLTFACVVGLLGGIELLACYTAAQRAAAVDPNVALKHD